MPKKLTKEIFIDRANKVHNNVYDYSEVDYFNNSKKVKINCPIHGIFLQSPDKHMSGQKCPACSGKFDGDTDWFIERAKEVHRDKYDYSLVEYINSYSKVKIICKEHGIFEQKPNNHISSRQGCPTCAGKNIDTSRFIRNAVEIHGETYDYKFVDYVNSKRKVEIVCKIHGPFLQTPSDHLDGCGCKECGRESQIVKRRSSLEDFITNANKIHNNKFDYSKVVYKNSNSKITIVCPIHGEFEQLPASHLSGKGCFKCFHEENSFYLRHKTTKTCYLYYIKIITNLKTYYKIGVTSLTVESRFKREIKTGLKIIPLKIENFDVGYMAYKKELKILREYAAHKTKDTPLIYGGNTEVFDIDVLNLDK